DEHQELHEDSKVGVHCGDERKPPRSTARRHLFRSAARLEQSAISSGDSTRASRSGRGNRVSSRYAAIAGNFSARPPIDRTPCASLSGFPAPHAAGCLLRKLLWVAPGPAPARVMPITRLAAPHRMRPGARRADRVKGVARLHPQRPARAQGGLPAAKRARSPMAGKATPRAALPLVAASATPETGPMPAPVAR